MTLLDKTPLPFWAWIVIIVVGSLCLIGIAAVLALCLSRHRKGRSTVDDHVPTRRVTVRRGRVVPASHYLSLTGSKFGVNQFDEESTKTRSRSPFEWWNTVKDVKERKHTQHPSGDIYTRREFGQSNTSLTSEKVLNTPSVRELEVPLPSPIALPSPISLPPASVLPPAAKILRHTSFSRPFNTHTENSSPDSPLVSQPVHSRNLSMIEEAASPNSSTVSIRSAHRRSLRMSQVPAGDATRQDSRRPSNTSTGRASAHNAPTSPSVPSFPGRPTPLPVAYNGSRANLGEQENRPNLAHQTSGSASAGSLSRRSSVISRHDSVVENQSPPQLKQYHEYKYQQPHDMARRQSRGRKRSSEKYSSDADSNQGYRKNRTDLRPVSSNMSLNRSNSKKGNVLRKKSLRRQEVVSLVGA